MCSFNSLYIYIYIYVYYIFINKMLFHVHIYIHICIFFFFFCYIVDFRQYFVENPNKLKNIVLNQMNNFNLLYSGLINRLPNVEFTNDGRLQVRVCEREIV